MGECQELMGTSFHMEPATAGHCLKYVTNPDPFGLHNMCGPMVVHMGKLRQAQKEEATCSRSSFDLRSWLQTLGTVC
jgi:hypothetical protein